MESIRPLQNKKKLVHTFFRLSPPYKWRPLSSDLHWIVVSPFSWVSLCISNSTLCFRWGKQKSCFVNFTGINHRIVQRSLFLHYLELCLSLSGLDLVAARGAWYWFQNYRRWEIENGLYSRRISIRLLLPRFIHASRVISRCREEIFLMHPGSFNINRPRLFKNFNPESFETRYAWWKEILF